MTAIEDNELTLMNPIIVSLDPNIWFKQMVKAKETSSCNSSSQHNCSQWVNPQEKSTRHAKEVSKWLSKKPNKPWLPKNGRHGGATRRGGVYSGAHWICDSELYRLRMFGETGPWDSKSDSYNRMIRGCNTKPAKSNRFNSSKRGSNYPWIPPIQLPPSMLNFDEKKPEQERSSSIFSTGNSATASCGKQMNGNLWGCLATEVDVQQEIRYFSKANLTRD